MLRIQNRCIIEIIYICLTKSKNNLKKCMNLKCVITYTKILINCDKNHFTNQYLFLVFGSFKKPFTSFAVLFKSIESNTARTFSQVTSAGCCSCQSARICSNLPSLVNCGFCRKEVREFLLILNSLPKAHQLAECFLKNLKTSSNSGDFFNIQVSSFERLLLSLSGSELPFAFLSFLFSCSNTSFFDFNFFISNCAISSFSMLRKKENKNY